MKIGVISDTHGDLQAWQQALAGPFKDVDLILHAGDVLYHGPRNPLLDGYGPADLAEAINACEVPIMIAQGNCDSEVDQMVLDIKIQNPYVITDQPQGRILVTHGHRYNSEQIDGLIVHHKIDIWISGHTHIPILEKQGDVIFLNPGSCSLPKGEKPRRSVAIIESDQIQLVDIDTNQVYKTLYN